MSAPLTIGAITACAGERVVDGSLQRLIESAKGRIGAWTVVLHGVMPAHSLDCRSALPAGINYIRRDRVSLSEARNLALAGWLDRGAVPDVVCFPDDDCLFEPETLAAVCKTFEDQRTDVLLGAYAPSPDRVDRHRFPARPIHVDSQFLVRSSSSITIFARTPHVLSVGGFDERLGAGAAVPAGEDTDLLLRMHHQGARLCYEPKALMRHEYKPDAGTRYHPHAAALLSMHAMRGFLPPSAAVRSVGALLVRVAGRRYSPSALRHFARSGSYLCLSSRQGMA